MDQQNLKQLDVKYLCNIARRGGKVMVVASSSFDDGRNADTVVVDELERTFKVRIEDGR